MQVNSVNSTSFKSLYTDYKEQSDDMRRSVDAVRNLRTELLVDNNNDGSLKPKNIFGIAASIGFAAVASYFLTKKGYNSITSLIDKFKKDDLVKPVLNNPKLQNAASVVKGTLSSIANVTKNSITNKIPEAIKSNRLVDFVKTNKLTETFKSFKPSTKIGLLGAAVGTTVAGNVDGNGDGKADMFQKGISWVDSLAEKSDKIMSFVRTVS